MPSISVIREYAEAGGLVSYDVSYAENYRHAAIYVDKIFKGAKPGGLPVEQPTTYEMVINLKTARALGLNTPKSLLITSDEGIQ